MNKQTPSLDVENKAIIKAFYRKHYGDIDAQMGFFIWGHVILGFIWAFFYDTYVLATLVGVSHLGIYYLCYYFFKGTAFSRYIISLMMWSFASAYLIQMHGMYEMHFFFFSTAATLILYHDWKVQLPLFTFALVHHVGLAILHMKGLVNAEDYLFNNISLQVLIIHLAIVLIDTLICIRIATYVRSINTEQIIKSSVLEKQMKYVEQDITFAEEISKGNLHTSFTPTEHDKLGIALSNMQQSLLKASKLEKSESYINVGLVELSRIIRENTSSVKELTDKFLVKLIQYLNIQQGCFYIKKTTQQQEEFLELLSTFACDINRISSKEILKGEGLIGQSFSTGKILKLDTLPDDYIHTIPTGLGAAKPKFIIIVPAKINENIEGVLELASFRAFEEHDIRLLERASESIAIALSSVKAVEFSRNNYVDQSKLNHFDISPEEEVQNLLLSKEELIQKKKDLELQLEMIEKSLMSKTE